jgi:hypothetical protein
VKLPLITRGTLLLVLPIVGFAAWKLHARIGDKATLQVFQDQDGTFRIGLTLERDRNPPDCEVVGQDVRATVDDFTLGTNKRGEATRATALGNGITIPAHGCDGKAWFTIDYIPSRPDGEVGVVRVRDGARALEMRVLNLRALMRAELSVPAAAIGDTVTMRVHPDGDPPLLPKSARLWIMRGDKPVATFADRELNIRDRSVSFVVPRLEPGTYGLSLGVGEQPRTALTCQGVSECVIDGFRTVKTVPIVVR